MRYQYPRNTWLLFSIWKWLTMGFSWDTQATGVKSYNNNHLYFPLFPAIPLRYTQAIDVESSTNNHLYFPNIPAVALCCLLLDSPSSSLSLTRRTFCERSWGISRLGHSTLSLSAPPWQATPHLTSAFRQAHLRLEHQLCLSLHLQKTGTLSVVLSRAATACKVIFRSGAGVGIPRSMVDGSGINSDVG